jgi:hypothetical protein
VSGSNLERRHRLRVTVTLGAFVLLVVLGAVAFARAGTAVNVPLEVARLIGALAGNVALTGFVTYSIFSFLSERDDERGAIRKRLDAYAGALQDLKAGFEKAQYARFMLQASPTADSFIQQMPRIFEARELLQRVQRERHVETGLASVRASIQLMLDDLSDLSAEYRDNYPTLRSISMSDSATLEAARQGDPGGSVTSLTEDARFSKLQLFLDDNCYRAGRLWNGYGEAKAALRAAAKDS